MPAWAEGDGGLRHGYHWLRLEVTLVVDGAKRDLDPLGQINVEDAVDQEAPDYGIGIYDPACETDAGGVYSTGETFGPTPLCFQVAGPVDGPLTLI